ncbi:uncharacterized protein MAM_03718 [Metarhizium album ARSEF 1941]|uniref:Uncharacterized protein n=1 Tax=Metarhizium album (strain ARSEF 1941) TaxID=1081103 RepID=A0A0B2WYC1_METAS|nr:uncharacterized protein MAM_03718 [Metarhizium album ARSEF 1941]KHN98594.1 hypothetical protein MAM_03718 [Metarhizium album ARSEF 1941]
MAENEGNMQTKEGEMCSQHESSGDWPEEDCTGANDENFNLSSDKGKGKSAGSMIDRLQSSGRGIIQGTITDKRMTAFSSSQKGGGESSASAHFTAHQSISGTEQQRNRQAPDNTAQQSFKSDRRSQGISDAFEAFEAGEKLKLDLYTPGIFDSPRKDRSVMEQEALDGSDVVAFISRSEVGDSVISEEPEEPEELTPSEASRLREALFESGSSWPFWDQLLNFNPDFVVRADGSRREADIYMGTSDAELARSTWLRHWNDVLSSYTDEVWGDLGPLAAEAKGELEQNRHTQQSLALNRLRLILTHVRGH